MKKQEIDETVPFNVDEPSADLINETYEHAIAKLRTLSNFEQLNLLYDYHRMCLNDISRKLKSLESEESKKFADLRANIL